MTRTVTGQAEQHLRNGESGRQQVKTDVWSPMDFEQELHRMGTVESAFKRFARHGVRTLYHMFGGTGTSEMVRFEDGVLLNVVNCVLPLMATWHYDTDEALIMLRASLCCDVVFRFEGIPAIIFNRPEVTFACVPAGQHLAVDVVGGSRQQGFIALFRASTFAGRFGLVPDDLPSELRQVLTGTGAVGRIASFPLDHRLANLLADTIDTRLDGEMRVVQYAGRLTELVAFTMDAMLGTPSLNGGALHLRRDIALAQAALNRLQQEYRRPPLFSDLAQDVGTNQNKLKAVFKDAFGVTMAEYCLERRMREAQQLLLEASLTIAQVAERVGYEHQSSFAAAFRGHVGMSASEYRNHRAPFNQMLKAATESTGGPTKGSPGGDHRPLPL